ncbi:MAG: DnaJ domain-containing protein [Bryobacteraceae bacterium]
MNTEECWRILGVPADAGPEVIRQAYLDLARVWHPDRFQSDDHLRRIAEEHFQEVNRAYTTLKNYRPAPAASGAARTAGNATATATEEPQYAPPEPAWSPPPAFRKPRRPGSLVQTALVAAVVAAPFFALFKILPLLRVPVLDMDLIASRAFQPRILAPSRILDASSDVRSAAETLTEWANGDVIDLWKPAGTSAPEARVPSEPAPHIRPERKPPAAPQAQKTAAPPPASGADLLPAGRGGAGALRLSNHSDLEAIVKLVSRNRTIVRAVYIAPNSSATIQSIGIGVYELHVDLGRDLDKEHLRFGSSRFTPTPLGPFQFAEITSENGVSGNRYDIVLNPR